MDGPLCHIRIRPTARTGVLEVKKSEYLENISTHCGTTQSGPIDVSTRFIAVYEAYFTLIHILPPSCLSCFYICTQFYHKVKLSMKKVGE